MQDGMTSGWHMSRGGVNYGPYEWNNLVAWARDGRLVPDDLVWHPQLPAWTPASQVSGLFPAAWGAMPAYPGPRPRSSRKGLWALLAAIGLVIIAGAVVGALFATGIIFGEEPAPLIDTPMRSLTKIDVPYDSSELTVPAGEGGELRFRGVAVSIPNDAVPSDMVIDVKILREAFHMNQPVASREGVPEGVCVGPVADLGPAGTIFLEPVTLTLPYDEDLLPAGVSEDTVAAAYWDGVAWVGVRGALDTDENTITIGLREFAGIAWTPIAPKDGDGGGAIAAGDAVLLDSPEEGYSWTSAPSEEHEEDEDNESTDTTPTTTGAGSTGQSTGFSGVFTAEFDGSLGHWELKLDFGDGLTGSEGMVTVTLKNNGEAWKTVMGWIVEDSSTPCAMQDNGLLWIGDGFSGMGLECGLASGGTAVTGTLYLMDENTLNTDIFEGSFTATHPG